MRIPIVTGLAAVSLIAACGGGGGDSGAAAPSTPLAAPLAGYAGIWRQSCANHEVETSTFTLEADGTLSVALKDEFFANTDCSGAVVATGTYPRAPLSIRYVAPAAGASLKLLNGQIIATNVDRISATGVAATMTYTGTGVTTKTVNGKLVWVITYTGGSTTVDTAEVSSGTSSGALTIVNGELLTAAPVNGSATSFEVDGRYVR